MIAQYGLIALVAVWVVAVIAQAIVAPNAAAGSFQTYTALTMLGIAVCLCTIGAIQCYYAWSRNADAFLDWSAQQARHPVNWRAERGALYGKGLTLWTYRLLMGPFLVLFGSGFAVASYFLLSGRPEWCLLAAGWLRVLCFP